MLTIPFPLISTLLSPEKQVGKKQNGGGFVTMGAGAINEDGAADGINDGNDDGDSLDMDGLQLAKSLLRSIRK
jgi:hypothetical protein